MILYCFTLIVIRSINLVHAKFDVGDIVRQDVESDFGIQQKDLVSECLQQIFIFVHILQEEVGEDWTAEGYWWNY